MPDCMSKLVCFSSVSSILFFCLFLFCSIPMCLLCFYLTIFNSFYYYPSGTCLFPSQRRKQMDLDRRLYGGNKNRRRESHTQDISFKKRINCQLNGKTETKYDTSLRSVSLFLKKTCPY